MSEQKRPQGARPRRPLTEEEKLKRRRARHRREMQKRRRRRLAFLAVCAIILVVLVVVLIKAVVGKIGQAVTPKAEETTLTLMEDGSLIFEEVTQLSEEYDASKLEGFAKEQVKAFSGDEGQYVKLSNVDVDEGVAYVRTEYSDAEAYEKFTGYEVFYGTVSQAKSAGYDFSTTFNEVKVTEGGDGNLQAKTIPAKRETIVSEGDNSVFIIRENVNLRFATDLLYVSSEGTEVSIGQVKISAIDGNNDAPALTYIIFDTEDEGTQDADKDKGEKK